MSAPAAWCEENQSRLAAAIAEVRAAVEAFLADAGKSAASPERAAEDASAARPAELEGLCATLGLTTFERKILLLCAGVELDSKLADLCGSRPTFGMALGVFSDAHWSALSPSRPLRYWRLIEVTSGDQLTSSPIRIDERILHYLTGIQVIDERLRPLLKPEPAAPQLPPSHQTIAKEAGAAWRRTSNHGLLPVIQLCGADRAAKAEIAAAAAALAGLNLRSIAAPDIPRATGEIDLFVRLWDREAALSGSALLVEADEAEGPENSAESALAALIERLRSPLFVSTRGPRPGGSRALKLVEVSPLTAEEQAEIWRSALAPFPSLNGALGRLGRQFSLSASVIRSLAGELAPESDQASPTISAPSDTSALDRLWHACRLHARPRLEALAQRIEPAAAWEDLVLPEKQLGLLRHIAIHVRHRAQVYQDWGFGSKGSRGLGISAMFAGPSGTGKTMAAEVLANDLRLDLYRIDLSQVVSKYIGETEKNLRRIFDAAESGAAILLFDEADALFGKRSEVKDSHDRYANIEVSYLLQRMEAYRGLAILTTNRKSALDPAFLRRLRFIVEFPFPEAAQRAEIWRRIFPAATPVEGLRLDRLARLNAAGGHIRNIALGAAFLAAEAGQPVRMAHLLSAARTEFAKLERPLTDAEVAGWI
ncbi:MAG: ATP-binding protein [Deltaproteobacteria bacterium]|nr:ATP-binding protein [Deltaproteobacteria bacterium]